MHHWNRLVLLRWKLHSCRRVPRNMRRRAQHGNERVWWWEQHQRRRLFINLHDWIRVAVLRGLTHFKGHLQGNMRERGQRYRGAMWWWEYGMWRRLHIDVQGRERVHVHGWINYQQGLMQRHMWRWTDCIKDWLFLLWRRKSNQWRWLHLQLYDWVNLDLCRWHQYNERHLHWGLWRRY